MNCQQRTVARCGKLLIAAVLLGLGGCHRAPSTATTSSGANGVAAVSWIAPTHNTDGSKITDLVGYTIFYGTNPDNMIQSIQVRDPGATSYTIKTLDSGTTYYFSVVAYTAAGTRGGASATVSKKIP
jgi:hypothetical protein